MSFNVNGIRARVHQLQAVIERHRPEVIGLQEIKVADEQFPLAMLQQETGYHISYHGQKGHYGVAIMTPNPHRVLSKGFPGESLEAQRRFIAVELNTATGPMVVMNGYFPQGENRAHATKFPNKESFYANLLRYLQDHFSPSDALAIMGDFNIAYEDMDIGIGEDNKKRWLKTGKCSFLPEERLWLKSLFDWGLSDTFKVAQQPSDEWLSWFDYRSRGFEQTPKRGLRIDGIYVTDALARQVHACGVDYSVRAMEKPSDHAPVWAQLKKN